MVPAHLRKPLARPLVLLGGVVALSGCGSSSTLHGVQSDTNVQQSELKVEQQVRSCLPTASGAPDPLLLRRKADRDKFIACTGVAKNARRFDACAVKVLFGGLPTVARLEKGLTVCVEQNA